MGVRTSRRSVRGGVYGKNSGESKAIPSGLRSISGLHRFVKDVLGRNSGDPEAGNPVGYPGLSLLMGDRGLPAISSPNWRSLFVGRPECSAPLVFSTPSIVDGKTVINPLVEAVLEGVEFWEGCLVGQFFDKCLPLHVVWSIVDRLWGKHEMPEITTIDRLYIFRFSDRNARDWVLENGP